MDCLFAMGDLVDLVWVLKNFGPLFLAVIFFVWRDYRREDRLSQRINELEDEQRKVILPLVQECTKVITQNTDVMRQNTEVMTRLETVLDRAGR